MSSHLDAALRAIDEGLLDHPTQRAHGQPYYITADGSILDSFTNSLPPGTAIVYSAGEALRLMIERRARQS